MRPIAKVERYDIEYKKCTSINGIIIYSTPCHSTILLCSQISTTVIQLRLSIIIIRLSF